MKHIYAPRIEAAQIEAEADRSAVNQARRYMEVQLIRLRGELSTMLQMSTVPASSVDASLKDLFGQIDDILTDTFTELEREIPSDDDIASDYAMSVAEARNDERNAR